MDTRRTSPCLTSQSMATKDICILMVHNDPLYRSNILEMLDNFNHYEVMRFKRTTNAIKIVQEKKEWLNIVLTDFDQSHSNGFDILNYIDKECKLPVLTMTPRQGAGVVPVGLDSGATLYIVKSLSVDECINHWTHAFTEERGTTRTSAQSESPIRVIREDQNNQKRKSKETDEQSEEDKDNTPNEKKPMFIWDQTMHQKFLKAIELLGDRITPKNILEYMNVPSLTEKNVASHLQSYCSSLRRANEEKQSTNSNFGINSPPPGFFLSSRLGFIPKKTNHTQGPLLTPIQQRLSPFSNPPNAQSNMCPINTKVLLANNFSNYSGTSTTTSNLGQQNFVTINNNQASLISPKINTFPTTDTTHLHSIPITNENPQPDAFNNTRYAGLGVTANGELVNSDQTSALNINPNMEEKGSLLNEGNGNESVVQFPSMEIANNSEPFNMAPAEYGTADLWDEYGNIIMPDNSFDASVFERL